MGGKGGGGGQLTAEKSEKHHPSQVIKVSTNCDRSRGQDLLLISREETALFLRGLPPRNSTSTVQSRGKHQTNPTEGHSTKQLTISPRKDQSHEEPGKSEKPRSEGAEPGVGTECSLTSWLVLEQDGRSWETSRTRIKWRVNSKAPVPVLRFHKWITVTKRWQKKKPSEAYTRACCTISATLL